MEHKTGNGEYIILDSYIPADGDYIVVRKNGEMDTPFCVKLDKKKGKLEQVASRELLYYDYHSRLVSMNKQVDSGKIIHSNNYYSFWVKWESIETGKLDIGVIDRYFDTLKHPEEKYKKGPEKGCMSTLQGK